VKSELMRNFRSILDVDSALALDAPWRPMRIAVVGGRGVPSTYSGVETICENLFAEFVKLGHHVTVYCRKQVLSDKLGEHKGIKLVRTSSINGKLETPSHTIASCWHAVRNGDVHDNGKPFDLFSFHAIPPNVAQFIPARANIPTISHIHGLDHQREKWKGLGAKIICKAEREMIKHAAQLVTVNRSIVDYYRTNFDRDCALLPNGIHPVTDDFTPDRATLEQFKLEEKKFLVTISRLVPEKRHNDVINAFLKLNHDMKLVIVGEGNNSSDYVESLKKLAGNNDKIIFTGLQKGAALQTLFRCARLYVSASELEGLPSSLLECMDRNVCAVVSDIPPHRELMERVAGYDLLFPVGEVDALRRSLERALLSPEHAARFASGARQLVRSQYTWPVLARATEKLYLKVLHDRSSRNVERLETQHA